MDAIKDELENSADGGGKYLKYALGITDDAEWEQALLTIFNKLDDGFIQVIKE